VLTLKIKKKNLTSKQNLSHYFTNWFGRKTRGNQRKKVDLDGCFFPEVIWQKQHTMFEGFYNTFALLSFLIILFNLIFLIKIMVQQTMRFSYNLNRMEITKKKLLTWKWNKKKIQQNEYRLLQPKYSPGESKSPWLK
jgi:uncharacterized membrane protein